MSIGDSVLAKATTHFREQLQNKSESISVPEWGETIHYRPMNGRQRDAIIKHVNDGHLMEAYVESILLRARDEDGKLMFKPVHKRELMTKVDPDIIQRVATEMNTLDALLDDDDGTEEVTPKKS
ncbi:MAG TPA: hypothetical protein EYQ00_13565 [Dehalococcoidia bacterium]|nr:hypothetical protein [Dehalococcoidia bacterium]